MDIYLTWSGQSQFKSFVYKENFDELQLWAATFGHSLQVHTIVSDLFLYPVASANANVSP